MAATRKRGVYLPIYFNNILVMAHPQERLNNGNGDPISPGLCNQLEKVSRDRQRRLNRDKVPGLLSGHQEDGPTPSTGKGGQSMEDLSVY